MIYVIVICLGDDADVQRLLRSFDGYLGRRGRAASTRRQYAYSLRSFANWVGANKVGDLTPADLEFFLIQWDAGYRARRGLSLIHI